MHYVRNRLAIRLFVVTLCAGLASGETANDAVLRTLLQEGIDRGYPGVAMLTQGRDGKVRSAAGGYSNLEKRTPMQVDDAFHMASINKTLTAVATLRLVDQGKLSLNSTLKDALGDIASRIPYADRITVAQLLDHSSGIYATNNDMEYLGTVIGQKADPARIWKPEELVALAEKNMNRPSGVPGEGHYYADTNYVLLGMIVARASRHPFKEHLAKTLLEPLGMSSTYFYSDYLGGGAHPQKQTVQGYLLATDEIRSTIKISDIFKPVPGFRRKEGELLNTTLAAERTDAAGGLVTTLPDLLKFATALFRGKLLSPASQKFIMSAGEDMDNLFIGKKRVWALQAIRKSYGVLVYKEGDGPGGVNTLMAYCPTTGEIFVGFANIFGYFNEVEFLMDDVIGHLSSPASVSKN